MRAETAYPSRQVRPVHPEGASLPHPRAAEMADTILDVKAVGGNCRFKDLLASGFTSAEVTEFYREAEALALARQTRQIRPEPDRLADMIMKAQEAVPNRLPLPAGQGESTALVLAWGHYCAARAALLIDPWSSQRERCIERLQLYLDKCRLYPRERKTIARAVSGTLQKATH